MRKSWSPGEWSVAVEYVGGSGDERADVEFGPSGLPGIQSHQRGLGHPRGHRREQRDLMTQLGQSPREPHYHPLRAAVSLDREGAMKVEGDMHAAAMYWPPDRAANRSVV